MQRVTRRCHCRQVVRALAISLMLAALGTVLRADEEPRLIPSNASFSLPSAVMGFVIYPAIRDDLKLNEDQQKRINELTSRVSGMTLAPDPATGRLNFEEQAEEAQKTESALMEILTPAQIHRHRQLALQHVLITSGLSGFVEIPEIDALLQFDADQTRQIEEAKITQVTESQQLLQAWIVTRRQRTTGIFTNPDVTGVEPPVQLNEINERRNDQLSALLTEVQKKRLVETLGRPLPAPLPALAMNFRRADAPALAGRRGGFGGRGGRGLPGGFPVFPSGMFSARQIAGRRNGLGRTAFSDFTAGLGLLTQESVLEELKLTGEQVRQQVLYGGDFEELLRGSRQLDQWLSAAQLNRLRQLMLQYSVRRNGYAAIFDFKEVVDSLQLGSQQLMALEEKTRAERISTRQLIMQAIERDPEKIIEMERQAFERTEAPLTAQQFKQVAALLGEPFSGALSIVAIDRALASRRSARAQSAATLGYLTTIPVTYLSEAAVRNELQLSDEQIAAIPETRRFGRGGFPGGFPGGAAAANFAPFAGALEPKMLELLSDAQLQRYRGILLQGFALSEGPATIFRYKFVIDALSPTDDQKQQLLQIVHEDTRDYLRIPLAELADRQPALDEKSARRLDAALTDDQRETLAGLLGEPAKSLDEPEQPAPGAVPAAGGRGRRANN